MAHPNPPPALSDGSFPGPTEQELQARATVRARALLYDAAESVRELLTGVDDVAAQMTALAEPGAVYYPPLADSIDADDAQRGLAAAAEALRGVLRILTPHTGGPLPAHVAEQLAKTVDRWEDGAITPHDAMTEVRTQLHDTGHGYRCPQCERLHDPWCPPYSGLQTDPGPSGIGGG